MDLESESCALESVEDHGLTTTTITSTTPDGALSHGDGDDDDANSKIKANGSCSNGIIHDMGTSGNGHENTMPHDGEVQGDWGIEPVGNSVDSLPFMATSPARGSSPTTKGFGLKKWRRIRRDIVKDASAGADNSKVLKRVFSGAVNPAKPTKLTPAEAMQNSEGSVGSANLFRNAALGDGFVTRGSSLESRFTVASAFSAGTDSENSEDQSSKSSTAASAPRVRHDLLSVSEYAWDKNGVNNLSGKSVGGSAQRVQRGKGWLEISKKPRGERVKIKKENSHSSMESDSRSSNFVFVQGDCSVTSNGKKSGRSMNYDGENSDEAHAVEQQFSGGVHTSYGQENVGEVEGLSEDELAAEASWTDKGEKSENHQPPADQDPFVESILCLQSVQKALENEVQKLGEIGKVSGVVGDSSLANPEIHESSLPDQFDSESIKESNSLEFKVLSLTQTVQYLESRLEEAKAMLKVKESRVAELEATLNGDRSPKVESASTTGMQQEKSREIENELEGLFKRMIEAEIEHLALSSLRELGVTAGDQITVFEEQEALAGEQVQILNKLGEVENKAASLKKQAGELEKHRGDVLGTEKEVLEIQNRVCKVTACFFFQFILLILVLWLFLLQLSPFSGVVVPT